MIRVLIASEDHALQCWLREWCLAERGLSPLAQARSERQLLGMLRTEQPWLVVVDGGPTTAATLPRMLRELGRRAPDSRVLLACAVPSAALLMQAIGSGVHGLVVRSGGREDWLKAMTGVLRGETWFPRRAMGEALASLLHHPGPESPAAPNPALAALTGRQREIVDCLGRGMSNKQIGRCLGISPATVKTHLHNIFGRTGVSGRLPLLARGGAPWRGAAQAVLRNSLQEPAETDPECQLPPPPVGRARPPDGWAAGAGG